MSGHRTIPKRSIPPRPSLLYKQNSWSPDILRDEMWLRRKKDFTVQRLRRTKSVTDGDLSDLQAGIELGFGFDSPKTNPKLSDTFPALELYYAVHNQYNKSLSRCSSSSSLNSDGDSGTSDSIIVSGEDPESIKARLRQWAQVVACSIANALRLYYWCELKLDTSWPCHLS